MKAPDPLQSRHPDHPIESLFVRRWSPRAMDGSRVSPTDLNRLFEAARWAPSTYNEQEWRFRYAHRDTPHWQRFFDLLLPGNQSWCKHAGVLCAIFARTTFTHSGKPNPVHSFDCGAAYENLALQGASMGLVVHGMAGFHWDRASNELHAPHEFAVQAMFAVGHPGKVEELPPELAKLEAPSPRRKVAESAGEGPF